MAERKLRTISICLCIYRCIYRHGTRIHRWWPLSFLRALKQHSSTLFTCLLLFCLNFSLMLVFAGSTTTTPRYLARPYCLSCWHLCCCCCFYQLSLNFLENKTFWLLALLLPWLFSVPPLLANSLSSGSPLVNVNGVIVPPPPSRPSVCLQL